MRAGSAISPPTGEMDTCIVLRTALVKDGVMYVQAGAGIVADSESGIRAAGMRQQGEGPVPRRRGGAPLRERREARAVACRSRREASISFVTDRPHGMSRAASRGTPTFP